MKKGLAAAALLSLLSSALPLAAAGPEEFEMATYQVAFLMKGPAWSAEKTPERARLQEAHMAHIRKMAESGKLILAGPFADDGDLRGLFIFRTDSPEEAKALAEQDPSVRAGRLRLEWHPWYAAKNIRVTPHAESAPSR